MSSWAGADAEVLVSTWGYPSGTFEAQNANSVYEYDTSETYQTSRFTAYIYDQHTHTGYASTYGGDTINFHCRTFSRSAGRRRR